MGSPSLEICAIADLLPTHDITELVKKPIQSIR
jgi:hypothetical protein